AQIVNPLYRRFAICAALSYSKRRIESLNRECGASFLPLLAKRGEGRGEEPQGTRGHAPAIFKRCIEPQPRTAPVLGRSNMNNRAGVSFSNAGTTSPSPVGWERAGVRAKIRIE